MFIRCITLQKKQSDIEVFLAFMFSKLKEVNVLAKNFKFQLFLVIITEMLDDG